MGDLRDVVETFYKRDHVEIVEETQLKENMFFTDLNFTHEMRVTHIRWHPTLTGIFAMSVMENALYEPYLKRLSNRLSMPNMLMIWSMAHPLFPQVIKQFLGAIFITRIYLQYDYQNFYCVFVSAFTPNL